LRGEQGISRAEQGFAVGAGERHRQGYVRNDGSRIERAFFFERAGRRSSAFAEALPLKALGVGDAAIDELRAAATDHKAKADQASLKQQVVSRINKQVARQLDGDSQALLSFSVDAVTPHAVRTYFGFLTML
jgi:hypothetical protein